MAAPIDLSTSSSLEQQAYKVALAMQTAELAIIGDDPPDNVQVTFDTEAQTVALNATLGTTLSVSDGNAVIGINTYLT